MQESIFKEAEQSEFFTQEQCFITESLNSLADPELSIAKARVKPGVTTHWHRLTDIVERYYILSGSGEVEVGQLAATPVSPGDIVYIPSLCRQRIRNTGTEDLVFLALCTPRFVQDAYEDLETN